MSIPISIQSSRHPNAAIPTYIADDSNFSGPLIGYYINNTQWYNIIPQDAQICNNKTQCIGFIMTDHEIAQSIHAKEFIAQTHILLKPATQTGKPRLTRGHKTSINLPEDMKSWSLYATMRDIIPTDGILIGYHRDNKLYLFEIYGSWEAGNPIVTLVNIDRYSLKLDLFSRNTGILESDIMLGKKALFIGCGSVGSLVAVELAKAGVGNFMLVDNDIFSYHNICRHQCGIYDVGRFKTDALAERILAINPYANVINHNRTIQDVDVDDILSFCDCNTVIVGGADNREGDLYACEVGLKGGASFVSIGCWERAFAGEIFYCLPKDTPTYRDFLAVTGYVSGRVTQNRRFYTTETDLEKASFEPGISADINFVTIIGVKLILDLLNRDNESYTKRLLSHLTQYTLVCNTNDIRIGGEQAEIFSYPLQVTTSIVVPYADELKTKS